MHDPRGKWGWWSGQQHPPVGRGGWQWRGQQGSHAVVVSLVPLAKRAAVGLRVGGPGGGHLQDLVHHGLDGREVAGHAGRRGSRGTHGRHLALGVALEVGPLLDDLQDLAWALADLIDARRDGGPRALLDVRRHAAIKLA